VPDQALVVTAEVLRRLSDAKGALHFGPDADGGYTGVHEAATREEAELVFSRLIDTLVAELPEHPSKAFVLEKFEAALNALDLGDTEDRERAATHCQAIMDILGIQSSDGVLNRWMYGPLLGSMLSARKP